MTETQLLALEFRECDTCRAKPGTPLLCDGCLHNRLVIAELRKHFSAPVSESSERLKGLVEKWRKRAKYDSAREDADQCASELEAELGECAQPSDELPVIDEFPCWTYIVEMINQNVKHKSKGYGLGDMTWFDQLEHLQDEVKELKDAVTAQHAKEEIADVLGVVLHMAIFQGDTPQTLSGRLFGKLRARFEMPNPPQVAAPPATSEPQAGERPCSVRKTFERLIEQAAEAAAIFVRQSESSKCECDPEVGAAPCEACGAYSMAKKLNASVAACRGRLERLMKEPATAQAGEESGA